MKRAYTAMEKEETNNSTMAETGLHPTEELIEAVADGRADTVKNILESAYYDVNVLFDRHDAYEDNYAIFHKAGLLHLAAAYGHVETVSVLILAGADVNFECKVQCYLEMYSKTALGCAILGSHVDVFKVLLKAGSNVNARTHFHTCFVCPPLSLVANVATDPNSKLTLDERKEMIEWLLEAGADIHHKGHWGKTVLFDFCDLKNQELLEWALTISRGPKEQGGIDFTCLLEVEDGDGRTPLYRAVDKAVCVGSEEETASHFENVASLLLRFGADPNAKKRERWRGEYQPLLFLVLRKSPVNPKVYRLLVDHGADEAEVLHYCCCHGSYHFIVASMLKLGCRAVKAKDSDGLYPFQVLASKCGEDTDHKSLTTLFLLLSADPTVLEYEEKTKK